MNEVQAHRLAGTVALVTGGARGIGEATVRRLIAEGAQVVLGDVLVETGELLAKELGAAASFVELDVTSETDWKRAIEHCVATFGPPSILVRHSASRGLPLDSTRSMRISLLCSPAMRCAFLKDARRRRF